MSGQDDYLTGQNLGLVVILTGPECGFQSINGKKIICFISGKYKQLNHKISQQPVVTKKDAEFSIFFNYGEKKISVFENIRIRMDRALVFTTKIASNVSGKLT